MRKYCMMLAALVCLAACEKNELLLDFSDGSGSDPATAYFLQKDEAVKEAFQFLGKTFTKSSANNVAESIVLDGETIAYSVNLPGGGWALLSADKRTQTVLAYNESGNFETSSIKSGPAELWFDDVCSDLLALRKNGQTMTDSPHLKKWEKMDSFENRITKGGGDEHENEWLQLVYTAREYVEEDNVNHLIATKWGQGAPWNQMAPFNGENSSTRCYTGCVTTALAQLLYYLHFKNGLLF